MVRHGGSSAGSYLADPTSPIPSHCASIVATSTVRVNLSSYNCWKCLYYYMHWALVSTEICYWAPLSHRFSIPLSNDCQNKFTSALLSEPVSWGKFTLHLYHTHSSWKNAQIVLWSSYDISFLVKVSVPPGEPSPSDSFYYQIHLISLTAYARSWLMTQSVSLKIFLVHYLCHGGCFCQCWFVCLPSVC